MIYLKYLPAISLWFIFGFYFACTKSKPQPYLLVLHEDNNMEFLNKKGMTKLQLSKSLDSLIKINGKIYLMLDIEQETSYNEFYKIRKILQKYRDNLLIGLKKNGKVISFFKISEEPDIKDIKKYNKNQIIKINKSKADKFIINQDSTITKADLKQALLKEAERSILNYNKTLIFLINISKESNATYGEYEYIGNELIKAINTLKNRHKEIKTKIVELQNVNLM